MKKDVNGYVQMDDYDYAVLTEMLNKFRDENHNKKISKGTGPKRSK